MFCERCGRTLGEGELTCPECGAYYGPVKPVKDRRLAYFFTALALSAAAAGVAAWFLGYYMLICMLFFWFGPRPNTNLGFALRGIGLGLFIGCVIGLSCRFLMS